MREQASADEGIPSEHLPIGLGITGPRRHGQVGYVQSAVDDLGRTTNRRRVGLAGRAELKAAGQGALDGIDGPAAPGCLVAANDGRFALRHRCPVLHELALRPEPCRALRCQQRPAAQILLVQLDKRREQHTDARRVSLCQFPVHGVGVLGGGPGFVNRHALCPEKQLPVGVVQALAHPLRRLPLALVKPRL